MRTNTTLPNIFTLKTIHWYVDEMHFVIVVIVYAWKHTPDVKWVIWTVAELKFLSLGLSFCVHWQFNPSIFRNWIFRSDWIQMIYLFVSLFVIFRHNREFSLIWRRHNYPWKFGNFDLCSPMNPCPRDHEIYHFDKTFPTYRYYIRSLYSQRYIRSISGEIMHFYTPRKRSCGGI